MSSLRMLEDALRAGAPAPAGRPRLIALLSVVFNCFALNGLVVLACLPIVTVPAALRAGLIALDRWREADDDRVARVFGDALVVTRWRAVTAAIGAPLAAALLAGLEVQYFAGARTPADAICLGLGAGALLICTASVGYAIVLSARHPQLPALAVWSAAASLAVRRAFGPSALLVAEIGLLGAVLARDPALTVVCVPLALLALVRATAGSAVDQAVAMSSDGPPPPENGNSGRGGER
jgi:hypothetical protein